MSLLAVGTIAFDCIENKFGRRDKIVGGSAMYISLAASFLYNKINISSIVGGDFSKSLLDELFESRGIGMEGVEVKENEKSFFWAGKYLDDINERETLVTELNVLEQFNPIIPDTYQDCAYLLLGNIEPRLQAQVLGQLTKRPKLVVCDTIQFYIENRRDELQSVIEVSDILSINDEEALQLTGERSILLAAEKILSWGLQYVIIKKGEHGLFLMSQSKEMFSITGLPLKNVIDPTGAGDSFAGGLLGYIAQKNKVDFETIKTAAVYGSCLASFCVEAFGNERLLTLNKNELLQRLNDFYHLSNFQIP